MGRWVWLGLAAVAVSLASGAEQPELPPLRAAGPLGIQGVQLNALTVPRFTVPRLGLAELVVALTATYDNPFDPEQLELSAEVTSPDGQTHRVPGFYYQPFRRLEGGGTPLLEPDGEPSWRIRFTPDKAGAWTYRVVVKDRSGEVASEPGTLTCAPADDAPGYIQVDPQHPRYFVYGNGRTFFPVGQNLQNDWPEYTHSWRLAQAGCNAARAWTFCHWTWLEWSFSPNVTWAKPGHFMHSYGGAGIYNQRIAWIADDCLARWEADGLRIMMCLGNGSELGDPDSRGAWGGHPYNVANGGWLEHGSDFWTDARARKAYRNRLRYIVARWGYSTTIWAWEFWNEIGRENDAIIDWHREMADYLQQLDPHHLVTTSHWGTNAEASPRLWNLPGLDFMQTHNYAGPQVIEARTKTMLAIADKPVINGEGGGPGGKDNDPTGIDLHNCLWAAPMSGAAGTTLPWWWRERIEPRRLGYHYHEVGPFFERLLANPGERRPLDPASITVKTPNSQGLRPVLFVPIGPGWGQKATQNQFVVEPDGTVPNVDQMAPVLYGRGKQDWRNPPSISVDYPEGGRFVVNVQESSHGILMIELDGKEVLRDEQFNVERKGFGVDVSIDVPAGQHTIRLDNAGSDWLRVARILLTDYRDAAVTPDLVVYGLRAGNACGLWIHHRLDEWSYRALGFEPEPVEGATISISMPAGWYSRMWSDTLRSVRGGGGAPFEGGEMVLNVPVVKSNLACEILPGNPRGR